MHGIPGVQAEDAIHLPTLQQVLGGAGESLNGKLVDVVESEVMGSVMGTRTPVAGTLVVAILGILTRILLDVAEVGS
jgi:hypothetical protein